ncbi:22322_t:CDS:2 [Cetraspora pellucida]|uniref:22322_t:CDS:1 n=1 Tax=Cetraspora pellucida TaxID=1433469 RepID=A0A9N9C976_9GLOM|nr:22322_t:CDS:2 [Cetraspora pellucida]
MTTFYLVVEQVETITEENVHLINIQLFSSYVEVEMNKKLFNNYLELIQKQFLEFVESIKIK